MIFLKLKCPPPIVMIISAAVALLLSQRGSDFFHQQIADVANLIWPMSFFIAGLALALAGIKEFVNHSTTVNPLDPHKTSSLVVSGIFQLTRNPMYLGMLVALLGWGDLLDHLLGFSGALIFFGYMTVFQIQPEEEIMLEKFGESYRQYCMSVRRWL